MVLLKKLLCGKDLIDWFTTRDTFDLFYPLAENLGLDFTELSAAKYTSTSQDLTISRRGVWLPDGLKIRGYIEINVIYMGISR
jgi:hypothetical protein